MPTVITCPKCGGNGIVTIGMTWEEAINLSEQVMKNENFRLEAIQSKRTQDHRFYVVVVTDKILSNTIYELTSYRQYKDLDEELKRKRIKNNATSGYTSTTSDNK